MNEMNETSRPFRPERSVEYLEAAGQKQREYVRRFGRIGRPYDLVVVDAFLRGMRDLGYRDTGTALDELNDNSFQAGAVNVHHAFAHDSGIQKPDRIAVIDDGQGMEPGMIRLAVMWGGTHRENDRQGFGRYGYGLPSACMSQGSSFSVYSSTGGGKFHHVTVDLDNFALRFSEGTEPVEIGEPKLGDLPPWVQTYIREQVLAGKLVGTKSGQLVKGTVVIIEKLDRLTWKTSTSVKRALLQHFGLVYRKCLREMRIFVHGSEAEPIDPLFTTPGAQFYDWDSDRAVEYPPIHLSAKDPNGVPQSVGVRFSYLPPTFARIDKTSDASKRARNSNPRWDVMDAHKGIIVCRSGRQVDVITRSPWTVFRNNDRYWNVEIDFPAGLDEDFSITTSKQRVIISHRMWELLEDSGVWARVEQMRKRFEVDRARLAEQEPYAGQSRSEMAMRVLRTGEENSHAQNPHKEHRERRWLIDQVAREHFETGRPLLDVLERIKTRAAHEVLERPYVLVQEHVAGSGIFRHDTLAGRRYLYLNTAHRFFTDVYRGPETSTSMRTMLEILCFTLADSETEAGDAGEYEELRAVWSRKLDAALSELERLTLAPAE